MSSNVNEHSKTSLKSVQNESNGHFLSYRFLKTGTVEMKARATSKDISNAKE